MIVMSFNTILAQSAPDRYKMGMIEDVDDYRKQLKAYNAEAVGMGIGWVLISNFSL